MASDLSATVSQSSSDKLLNSVSYPFTAFDQSWPFQGRALTDLKNDHNYDLDDIKKMLASAQKNSGRVTLPAPDDPPDESIEHDILRAGSEIIQSAKACLDARLEAEKQGKEFQGPTKEVLQGILDGGVAGLANIQGIQFKGHLAWLKVVVASRPNLSLNVPTIGLTNLNVEVSATGELWWYHPTIHCSMFCLHWSVTWGWDRIGALTVNGVKLAIAAHADVSAQGSLITARGVVDRLRLDYPILRDIPLEGLANNALGSKLVKVFDASTYLATVPVLNSKFTVSNVVLPPSSGQVQVDISIKQV